VAAIGATLLIVSLFLDWYENATGFTVFEFLDLLLLSLGIATLAALADAMGVLRTGLRPGVQLALAMIALLIVLSQIVNDPPAEVGVRGADQDVGIWLALGGAALMVAGAILSTARIAISVEPRDRGGAPTVTRAEDAPTTVAEEPPPPRP
jgi:hypothetical protein